MQRFKVRRRENISQDFILRIVKIVAYGSRTYVFLVGLRFSDPGRMNCFLLGFK
jgi:hypothetical protein